MPEIVLQMDVLEARALWHAAAIAAQLLEELDDVPPSAPLYGQRDRLVSVARRLNHEINQARA